MIYDVKPGAKLQRNPQISKSFAFRTKNKLLSARVGGSCGTGGTGGNGGKII